MSDPPFKALFEKVSKMTRKKSCRIKKARGKKSRQIKKCLLQKLSEILHIRWRFFFFLTKIQNEDSRAKKRFLEGSKKARGKKSRRIKKCLLQKLSEILHIRWRFFFFLTKFQK